MSRGDWLLVSGPEPAAGAALTGLIAETLAEELGERVLLIGPVSSAVEPSPNVVTRPLPRPSPRGVDSVAALNEVVARAGGRAAFDRVLVDPGTAERRLALLPHVGHLVQVAGDTFAALPGEAPPGCLVTFVGELPRARAPYRPQLFRAGTCRAPISIEALAGRPRRATASVEERAFLGRLARAISGRRVGLALGGGGAWGFAHIALIEALARRGIPIDVVSGVSFGAIVGALYCSGGLPALRQLVNERNGLAGAIWLSTLHSAPLERFIDVRVPQRWLERLPVPFIPIATHVETGEADALRMGRVGRAVRASGSLPGLVGPTLIGGVRYVDGGISCNVPANLLPAEGAGLVIASDVMQRPAVSRKSSSRRLLGLRDLGSELNPFERAKDLIMSMSTLTHNGGALNAVNAHVSYQAHGAPYAPWDFHRGREILAAARADVDETVDRVEHAWLALAGARR